PAGHEGENERRRGYRVRHWDMQYDDHGRDVDDAAADPEQARNEADGGADPDPLPELVRVDVGSPFRIVDVRNQHAATADRLANLLSAAPDRGDGEKQQHDPEQPTKQPLRDEVYNERARYNPGSRCRREQQPGQVIDPALSA